MCSEATSVNIWTAAPVSNSIADIAFAPVSTDNIELTNDYEPVAYQANRSLRAAQAAMELNALQERNHATTAYSTLNCVATPLFPTMDAERALQCSEDKAAGVGEYTNRERHALVRRASSGCNCSEWTNAPCQCNPGRYCAAPVIGYDAGFYVRPSHGHRMARQKKKEPPN